MAARYSDQIHPNTRAESYTCCSFWLVRVLRFDRPWRSGWPDHSRVRGPDRPTPSPCRREVPLTRTTQVPTGEWQSVWEKSI